MRVNYVSKLCEGFSLSNEEYLSASSEGQPLSQVSHS